jgi:hypothetical protein
MSTDQGFHLPVVAGRTFKNETVVVDGRRFENCKFIGCTIIYSGGPAEASACEFSPNTVWGFQEPVGTSLKVLQAFGWRFEYGPKGPLAPAIPIPIPKA